MKLYRYITYLESYDISDEDILDFICSNTDFDPAKVLDNIKNHPDIVYDVLMDIKENDSNSFEEWIELYDCDKQGKQTDYDIEV